MLLLTFLVLSSCTGIINVPGFNKQTKLSVRASEKVYSQSDIDLIYEQKPKDVSAYCILENSRDQKKCYWVKGELPNTFISETGDGVKVLTVWVKNKKNVVSDPYSTPKFVIDSTPPVWATAAITHAGTHASLTMSPSISFNENATDLTTQVSYEYAIGSGSGVNNRANIKTWTKVTANPFQATGLSLTDGSTYYVSMRAVDEANNISTVHTSSGWLVNVNSPNPSFVSITPNSPSSNASPVIVGTVSVAAQSVSLYSDASCTVFLGNGSRADFVGSGITLTVPLNPATPTNIYGQSEDANSNLSACSLLTSYRHDSVGPTVARVYSNTAAGAYNTGDVIDIRVEFSENISIVGNPSIVLETGSTDATPTFGSVAGSNTLIFSYTVASGHESADLNYVATTSLTAGTSIKDAAGNDATLTLPGLASGNSLAGQEALVIDGVAPAAPSIVLNSPASSPGTDSTPTFEIELTGGGNFLSSDVITLHEGADCSGSAVATLTSETGTSALITRGSAMSNGASFDFRVKITDAAGNSNCSTAHATPASRVATYEYSVAPPAAPGIVLQSPTLSPGADSTPSFTITLQGGGNFAATDTITLFNAAACGGTSVGTSTGNTGTSVVLATGAAQADGNTTTYSVRVTNAASASTCSSSHTHVALRSQSYRYNILTLNAQSITMTAHSGQTYTFVASGGTGPYTYSIDSGTGSIDPSTGVFTAGTSTTTNTIVRVSDSAANSVTATVRHQEVLFNGFVSSVVAASTGERYYGGSFNGVHPHGVAGAVVLNSANGNVEHDLDLQSGFNGHINTSAYDPITGAYYFGGNFTAYRGVEVNGIAKLDRYGNLDTTFKGTGSVGFSTGVNFPVVYAIVLDHLNRTLYVGGSFTSYRGVADSAINIAKLSTIDGSIDTTFHPVSATGGFSSYVTTLALDRNNNQLYVGGQFLTYRGVANSARYIAKLSTVDGSIDTTFHPVSASGGFNSAVLALALDSTNGQLYVGGNFTQYRGVANSARYIAKLSMTDGSIDTTFHPVSATDGFNSHVSALVVDAVNNQLYVGGNFTQYRGVANSARYIAKLSMTDGSIDTTFHPVSATGGFNSTVYGMALDTANGQLYVSGLFTEYRGVAGSAGRIAKISSSNGAIDTTFHPVSTLGGFSSTMNGVHLLAGNKILTNGSSNTYRSAAYAGRIAKVLTNGAIDSAFHPVSATGGFDNTIDALVLDELNNKLYVGGAFTSYRGVANSARRIAKLSTTNGAIDTTFHPVSASGGFGSYNVSSLALDAANNKIYVGGEFTAYRGVGNSAGNIAKLSTTDGAIDTTFHPVSASGGFDSRVGAIALDAANNKLYVGGSFSTYRGVANSAKGIAKLSTTDGAIDTTFHPVSASGGFYGFIGVWVNSLWLDTTNNKLYVGGNFSNYRGVTDSARNIAKLSTVDGSIDTTFHPVDPQGGFFYDVYSVVLEPGTTNLYLGGYFNWYRGVLNSANRIVKVSTVDGSNDTAFHPVAASSGYNNAVKSLYFEPSSRVLHTAGWYTAYSGTASFYSTQLNLNGTRYVAPTAPAIALSSPAASPGTDSTPSFQISLEGGGNFAATDTINLFAASMCGGSSVGTSTGNTGASVVIETSAAQADGSTSTYSARITDANGNSRCSSTHTTSGSRNVAYEYNPPSPVPLIAVHSDTPATGTSSSPKFAVTLTGSVNFSDGDVVTLFEGGNNTCNGTARGTSTVSGGATSSVAITTNSALAAFGAVTYFAKVTDTALNETCAGVGVAYTYRPAEPTTLVRLSPTGTPGNDTTPTIRVSGGGVANGSTVKLFTDSSCTAEVGTATADATPQADITSSALTAGAYLFYSTVTINSVSSACSSTAVAYLLDLTAPAAPSIALQSPASSPGNDATPTFTIGLTGGVNFASGDVITLHEGADCSAAEVGTLTSQTGTSALITRSSGMSETTTTFRVKVADEAGNSTCSTSHATLQSATYQYDNTPPSVPPVITFQPPLSSPGADSTPSFSVSLQDGGNFQASETVTLFNAAACGGSSVGTSTGNTGASVVLEANTAQADGNTTTYSVSLSDAAGNAVCSSTSTQLARRSRDYTYHYLKMNAQNISLVADSGQTFTFAPLGGTAPFSYSKVSGPGSIHPTTGVFTAGNEPSPTVVRVTDATAATADANIVHYVSMVRGSVRTGKISSTGDIYLGGDFIGVYPYVTPSVAAINSSDGALELGFDIATGFNGTVEVMEVDPETGAVFVAGSFTQYKGVAVGNIAKLWPDGSLDTTFNGVGQGFDGTVYALAVDSKNGYLYVGGLFTSYRGVANSAFRIAKLSTTDGTLDTTFHPNSATGGFDFQVMALALDEANQSLYVGGNFTTYRGVANSARRIAKLSTSNGALDTTFHPNSATGGFDSLVRALQLDTVEAKLYVGGEFTTYRNVASSARRIAKLATSDGAIDTTFHPVSATGGFGAGVYSFALDQGNGQLYVGGNFTSYRNVANSARYIAKLSVSNGNIDTTFHPVSASGGFSAIVYRLALNSAGTSLYVAGNYGTYRGVANSAWRIAKLSTADGAIDSTFQPASVSGGLDGSCRAIALDSSRGRVYVGGSFKRYRGQGDIQGIAKFNIDGEVDATFTSGVGFDSFVQGLELDETNNVLYVVGGFSAYRGVANSARKIAKLNATNGNIDTTFHPVSATGGFDNTAYSLNLDAQNNSLYVGGSFTTYRGVADSARRIAKLNATNGALDTTFHPNSVTGGFDGSVETSALDTVAGNLYVGGQFTTYRGVANSAGRVAKLSLSDGTLDTTFHPTVAGGGFDNYVESLVLDSARENLYLAGYFTSYRGVASSAHTIAKLDTDDGTLNTTFHPNGATTFSGFPKAVAIDDYTGFLYVGGYFSSYQGVANSARSIVRMAASNAAPDSTFHPVGAAYGLGPSTTAYATGLHWSQDNQLLLVTGDFSSFHSNPAGNAILLRSDGTIFKNAITPLAIALSSPAASPGTDSTPSFSITRQGGGNFAASDTVTLFAASACAGSSVGTSTGNTGASVVIETTAAQAAGNTTTYSALLTDASGNTRCSAANTTLADRSASYTLMPDTPTTVTRIDPVASPGTDTTPTIRVSGGGVVNGSTVKVFTDSSCTAQVGTATADATPQADVTTSNLTAGTYSLYATVSVNSVESLCSTVAAAYTLTVSAPPVPSLAMSSGYSNPATQASPSFAITLAGSVNFSDGDVVTLYEGGNNTCNGTARGTSTISGGATSSVDIVTNSALSNFSNVTYYAKVTDLAANSSCSSVGLAYTHRPAQPATLARQSPTGTPGNDTTPTIRVSGGGVANGSIVKLFTDSSCTAEVGSATADATPQADVTSSVLTAGAYLFYATVTINSVSSACSTSAVAYLLDTTPPAAPSIALQSPASSPGTDSTPTFTVALTGGANFALTDVITLHEGSMCNGAPLETLTSESGTSVLMTQSSPMSDGAIEGFTSKVTDEAGNSTCSTSFATAALRMAVYKYQSTIPLSLNATSISMTVHSSQTFTFAASSGTAPYTYSIDSGPGSIDSVTGVFTAGNRPEQSVVRVTDAALNSATATVNHYLAPVHGGITNVASASTGEWYAGGNFAGLYPSVTQRATSLNVTNGSVDKSFDIASGFDQAVKAMVRDPITGDMYFGGDFLSYRGVAVNKIAKLNSKGVLDTTFKGDGSGFNGSVETLALDENSGHLYVGGAFSTYRGVTDSAYRIAKLSTTDGAADTTFHPVSASGGFGGAVYALALDPANSSLYVGGAFTAYRGVANSARNIAKLSTTDGAIDTTFHPVSATGGFGALVRVIAVDFAGSSVYVGGDFTAYRGVANSARYIAKLSKSDGAIDTTFHPVSATGGFSAGVYALAVDSINAKLYVGGNFNSYRGVANSARYIAKLSTTDGAIDATFHPVSASGGFSVTVYALALDTENSKLYVGGPFTSYRAVAYSANYIAKLSTTDGAIDSTFHPVAASSGFVGQVQALALDSVSGRLYVGGAMQSYSGETAMANFAKFNIDGSLVSAFNSGVTFNSNVNNILLDESNQKLYVGGNFTSYRGVANSARYIAKLSATDGAIDTTFHPVSATGGFDNSVSALAIDTANSILYAGGAFTAYRNVTNSARYIAKLNTTNGNIDTTFHPVSATGGFNGSVRTLALDIANSALFVGGNFTAYRNVTNSARYIAKLSTTDGAIDTTFHPVSATGGFGSYVNALALDTVNSKLYVGGNFTSYRGVAGSANYIAKLSTSDGAIDTTFHPVSASGGFNNMVMSLSLDSASNSLYVAGLFNDYRGVWYAAMGVAKLSTASGDVDTVFLPTSINSGVTIYDGWAFAVRWNPATNMVLVSGTFSQFSGSTVLKAIHLRPNGDHITRVPAVPNIVLSSPASSPGTDSTPTFEVELTGGINFVASDVVTLHEGANCNGASVGSVTGETGTSVLVTRSSAMSEGTTTFRAKITDVDGNYSCSTAFAVTGERGASYEYQAPPLTISYAGATGTTGTRGVAMSVSPTTLTPGAGATITNCVIQAGGSLPTGMSIDSGTCVISGTPSTVLTSTAFTVRVTNSFASTADASVTLEVTDDWSDDNNNSIGYASATMTGVAWSTDKLILKADTDCDGNMSEGETAAVNCSELDSSWTPQWSSLIGYWKFNQSSWNGTAGEVLDSKGTNHGVRVGNATTLTDGNQKFGRGSANFDGTGDYVNLGDIDAIDNATELTACIWTASTTITNDDYLMAKYVAGPPRGGFLFLRDDVGVSSARTDIFKIAVYDVADDAMAFIESNPTTPSGRWMHVCFSFVPNSATGLRLYVNGIEDKYSPASTVGVDSIDATTSSLYFGSDASGSDFNGYLDEAAIWSKVLSAGEIHSIFARQYPFISGTMVSRVYDAGAANTWNGISWRSTLPFGKELPGDADNSGTITAADSETSTEYSTLSTNTLMNNLEGLWRFNGSLGTIADDATIADSSGYGRNGLAKDLDATNTIAYNYGYFGNSIYLDGTNDSVDMGNVAAFNFGPTTSFTLSTWMRTTRTDASAVRRLISKGGWSYANGYTLGGYGGGGQGSIALILGSGGVAADGVNVYTNTEFNDGRWRHVAAVIDQSTKKASVYVNGEVRALTKNVGTCGTLESSDTVINFSACTNVSTTTTDNFFIGRGMLDNSRNFEGQVDEVAIWSRALSATEIIELFRRGGNNIRFQVRACTTSDCSDNPRWLGPAGDPGADNSNVSYFSELHSNTVIDALGLPTGRVKVNYTDLLFFDFSALTVPSNRYFQYRAVFESFDRSQTLCSGTWCSPDLKSVTVSP